MSISCYNYAMKYIYRFPKTKKELQTQLRKKWYFDEEIEKVMNSLAEKWFLDDKMFTELYVGSEIVKKGKPEILVRAKLLQKWVDKTIIDDIMKKMRSDVEEWKTESIKKQIRKLKEKWVDWFDIIQKLLKKGYRLDDIKKCL